MHFYKYFVFFTCNFHSVINLNNTLLDYSSNYSSVIISICSFILLESAQAAWCVQGNTSIILSVPFKSPISERKATPINEEEYKNSNINLDDNEIDLEGYKEINKAAMKLLPRGGYLATCSCSHFMSDSLFKQMLNNAAKEAGVGLLQIEARQQSKDHPILWNVPETNYLKFYVFQIV